MTYFSRFIREDLYSLVFTLGTILAFRRFLETDRARWLTGAAVAFALAGVTKENAYMTGVLFVAFGLWAFALAARAEGPAAAWKKTWSWTLAHLGALVTAGIVFLSIWALFYSAFGRYPGDWLAIPKAVKYWMGQHAIARIPGPWFYYFPQLLYYETATVLAAAFAFRGWKRDPFLAFVVFWAVTSLAIYSWAREKVPWLAVHPLLPLTVLAGLGLANLWRDRKQPAARVALAVIAAFLALNASGAYLACFRYGAYDKEREPEHGEYLAYVQTTEDLIRSLARPRSGAGARSGGAAAHHGHGRGLLAAHVVPARHPDDVDAPDRARLDARDRGGLGRGRGAREAARGQVRRASASRSAPGGSPRNGRGRRRSRRIARRSPTSSAGGSTTGSGARSDRRTRRSSSARTSRGPGRSRRSSFRSRTRADATTRATPRVLPPDRVLGGAGSGPGELAEPRGLAVDGRGNLLVADTKNNRIEIFDSSGKFLRAFGRKGSGDGELNEPCGVAVDPEGDVWVADTWNHRIVHFSGDGQFRKAFGDPEHSLFGPRALVVSRGAVYVADTGNKRVVRFDREGKKTGEFGVNGTGPGQLVEPVGIAADASGNLVVADTGNHRVQVFDSDGVFVREFPVSGWKDFYTEPYLAMGPGDLVIVTDAWGSRVAVYDASGALRTTFRAGAEFKQPTGVAVDAFGRLSVSDRGTNRIFSWTLTSVLQ